MDERSKSMEFKWEVTIGSSQNDSFGDSGQFDNQLNLLGLRSNMFNHGRAECQVKGLVREGQVPAISLDEGEPRIVMLEMICILKPDGCDRGGIRVQTLKEVGVSCLV
jgi:hypothetical protein